MQRVAHAAGPLLAALALAASGYCAWAYEGPYMWIAEAQLSLSGSYGVMITFLLTFLAFLVPAVVIAVPLRLIAGAPGADAGPGKLDRWIGENRGSLIAGLLCLGLFGTSGYFAIDALGIGAKTSLDVAVLEAGGEPESRYVELSGTLLHRESFAVEEERVTKHYVPVVRDAHGQPVVFLETYDTSLGQLQSPYEGVLYEDGLPGMVREAYAARGAIAPRHYLLQYRRTPDQRWEMAGVFAVVGAVSFLVLVVLQLRARSRRRG